MLRHKDDWDLALEEASRNKQALPDILYTTIDDYGRSIPIRLSDILPAGIVWKSYPNQFGSE